MDIIEKRRGIWRVRYKDTDGVWVLVPGFASRDAARRWCERNPWPFDEPEAGGRGVG